MNMPERPKSKLVLGAIPAHTECPFLAECSNNTMKCMCGHLGKEHQVDFSCAIARGYDIFTKKKENKLHKE